MKIRTTPELKTFTFTGANEGDTFDVVIRKTNTNDAVELQAVFQKREYVVADEDGERTVRSDFNPLVANRRAAYLSLSEVVGLTDENDRVLFRSASNPVEGKRVSLGMTEQEFNYAWGLLDPAMTEFVMDCIRDFNPRFLS